MSTERLNLLGLAKEELIAFFASQGERSFRATQLMKWVHQSGVSDFQSMSNLSKSLREKLAEIATIEAPELLSYQVSNDGTTKWLFRIDEANSIETVYIPESDRGTLCVSSQAGCPLNCSFCATAKQGFSRNLSASEIIGQLWQVNRIARQQNLPIDVSNVVMMGMGEPLLNFENVVSAMQLMIDDNAYALASRRVTLSTAGMAPIIPKLKERCRVSLAVSLHAPNDELRNQLVPINKTYPIKTLLAACRDYVKDSSKATITFEYVMLDKVNDSPSQARQLVRLIRDLPAKVNLIPFNSFPGIAYRRSSDQAISAFREVLMAAGIMTLTRKTRGDDIDAACGQLAGQVQPRSARVAKRRGLIPKSPVLTGIQRLS